MSPAPCAHFLGCLWCMNDQPHKGNGHGCVHHASDARDRRHDDTITQETMT